ncbi:hypothetical protein PCC7424_4237 [Gloeothece citriformis PCC 7424]|uniref:Uncharacterized protein n=1 Tax=Gloeothece citriformis (strain PCC 7424) TaxID=65393 RepID=B7K6Q8_GLOC7|nr:hypothetical protein [Gloeothece citriformis]ACK72607.1 hypothetical protein PCC7424_4237 [Gloeothece citriformis PCC 7424]
MSYPSRDNPSLWLSLVTSPFLLFLIALQSVIEGLRELGIASEEIFRGDRLPILNISEKYQEEQQ